MSFGAPATLPPADHHNMAPQAEVRQYHEPNKGDRGNAPRGGVNTGDQSQSHQPVVVTPPPTIADNNHSTIPQPIEKRYPHIPPKVIRATTSEDHQNGADQMVRAAAREAILRHIATQRIDSPSKSIDQLLLSEGGEMRAAIIGKRGRELELIRTGLLKAGAKLGVDQGEIHDLFEKTVALIKEEINYKEGEPDHSLEGETSQSRISRHAEILAGSLTKKGKGERRASLNDLLYARLHQLVQEGKIDGFRDEETFDILREAKRIQEQKRRTVSGLRSERTRAVEPQFDDEEFGTYELPINADWKEEEPDHDAWKEFHTQAQREIRAEQYPESSDETESNRYVELGAKVYNASLDRTEPEPLGVYMPEWPEDDIYEPHKEELTAERMKELLEYVGAKTEEQLRRIRYPEAHFRWDSLTYERRNT